MHYSFCLIINILFLRKLIKAQVKSINYHLFIYNYNIKKKKKNTNNFSNNITNLSILILIRSFQFSTKIYKIISKNV